MIGEEALSMSIEELRQHLHDKEEALVNLRFQKALQQLERPHDIRITRRNIAQIKTLLKEYELGRRSMRTE